MKRKKYINLCADCAGEKADNIEWTLTLASKSSKVRCHDCGAKLRHYYRKEIKR